MHSSSNSNSTWSLLVRYEYACATEQHLPEGHLPTILMQSVQECKSCSGSYTHHITRPINVVVVLCNTSSIHLNEFEVPLIYMSDQRNNGTRCDSDSDRTERNKNRSIKEVHDAAADDV